MFRFNSKFHKTIALLCKFFEKVWTKLSNCILINCLMQNRTHLDLIKVGPTYPLYIHTQLNIRGNEKFEIRRIGLYHGITTDFKPLALGLTIAGTTVSTIKPFKRQAPFPSPSFTKILTLTPHLLTITFGVADSINSNISSHYFHPTIVTDSASKLSGL